MGLVGVIGIVVFSLAVNPDPNRCVLKVRIHVDVFRIEKLDVKGLRKRRF